MCTSILWGSYWRQILVQSLEQGLWFCTSNKLLGDADTVCKNKRLLNLHNYSRFTSFRWSHTLNSKPHWSYLVPGLDPVSELSQQVDLPLLEKWQGWLPVARVYLPLLHHLKLTKAAPCLLEAWTFVKLGMLISPLILYLWFHRKEHEPSTCGWCCKLKGEPPKSHYFFF